MIEKRFSKRKRVQNLLEKFPLFLENNNEKHILVFRRLLECSLKYGYWNGSVAAIS